MRTCWFGSVRDLLSRWTSSGTASSSVWNGCISSRVNARSIRTVLVRFHMEPFPCKRGLSQFISVKQLKKLQENAGSISGKAKKTDAKENLMGFL